MVKNPSGQCRSCQRHGPDPELQKISEEKWETSPVFLVRLWTEETGGHIQGHKESDAAED